MDKGSGAGWLAGGVCMGEGWGSDTIEHRYSWYPTSGTAHVRLSPVPIASDYCPVLAYQCHPKYELLLLVISIWTLRSFISTGSRRASSTWVIPRILVSDSMVTSRQIVLQMCLRINETAFTNGLVQN